MMTRRRRIAQHGTFSVEFALVVLLLLILLFGMVELARLMYIYNALQDATRDQAAMDLVRQNAVFRASPGELILGAPVTDSHVRIDYLAIVRDSTGKLAMSPIPSGEMPSCHARNRVTCAANPNDAHCIRMVRARICTPASGAACAPVYYVSLFGLFPDTVRLPVATTVVPAETLGYEPGDAPCP
jgi:hypothetical protein